MWRSGGGAGAARATRQGRQKAAGASRQEAQKWLKLYLEKVRPLLGRRMHGRDGEMVLRVAKKGRKRTGEVLSKTQDRQGRAMRMKPIGKVVVFPTEKTAGPSIEQHEAAAQARDRVSGLARVPSESVHFYRPSGGDLQLGQYLRGQNQCMARRDKAPHRLFDHFVLRNGRLHQPHHNVGVEQVRGHRYSSPRSRESREMTGAAGSDASMRSNSAAAATGRSLPRQIRCSEGRCRTSDPDSRARLRRRRPPGM